MANRKISNSYNFTPRDIFNLTGAESVQALRGKTISVSGCAVGEDISTDTGDIVTTGYLKLSDGKVYSCISKTAIQSIDSLIDMMADMEGEPVNIFVDSRTSRGGRDFIVLTMVD